MTPGGMRVTDTSFRSLLAERDGTLALLRRLLAEHALIHWRLYAVSFMLMALAAGCTAASAYLLGNIINEAYVDRNFPGIVALAAVVVALFTLSAAPIALWMPRNAGDELTGRQSVTAQPARGVAD